MASSSEIPPLLQAAVNHLTSEETAAKPVELQLASMLVKIKKLAESGDPQIQKFVMGSDRELKDNYDIVKEVASQFETIKELKQRKELEPLIKALHSWSELENADTNTRAIVKVAAKQLGIVQTRIPNIFIWIHEQFNTIAMAFNGLPEESRQKSINYLLDCEQAIYNILMMEQKDGPPEPRDSEGRLITFAKWKMNQVALECKKIEELLRKLHNIDQGSAFNLVNPLFNQANQYILSHL